MPHARSGLGRTRVVVRGPLKPLVVCSRPLNPAFMYFTESRRGPGGFWAELPAPYLLRIDGVLL
jgi:hypothetical protein